MKQVSYFVTGDGKKLNKDDVKVGFRILNEQGIPFEYGLSPEEAGEFTDADFRRASSYLSKYYDEIFGPGAMPLDEREASIQRLKAEDPVLYKVLQRTIGRNKWSKLDDGNILVDLNTGYQPGRSMADRVDVFSDKRKELRSEEQLEKAKERSKQADTAAVAKQDAAMSKDIDMNKVKESLDRAKERGDIANVGYKSEKQGGGLSGRSQGQLNQLRKTFVKNLLNTEKYPENTSILEEYGITDNDKDALLSFLKGPRGDSAIYGDYMNRYLDPVERTKAIFDDYKKQGKTNNVQSNILSALGGRL